MGAAPARCEACGTTYHPECLREFGGCSTLGCSEQGQVPARVRLPNPGLQALLLAFGMLFVSMVILGGLSWLLFPEPGGSVFHRSLAAGQQALRRGDAAAAVEAYTNTIERWPGSPLGYYSRGRARQQAGDASGAVDDYREATRLDPGFVDAQLALGQLQAELGEHEASFFAFRRVLEHEPNHLDALIGAEYALRRLGRLVDAKQALERALRTVPRSDPRAAAIERELMEVNDSLGWTEARRLLEAGKPAEAEVIYSRILRHQPDHLGALTNRGVARLRQDDLKGAQADFEAALLIQPDNATVLSNLSLIDMREGRLRAAASRLRRVLELDPNFGGARRRLDLIEGLFAGAE